MNIEEFKQEHIFTKRAAERIIYGDNNYCVSDIYVDEGADKVVVLVAKSTRLIVLEAQDFINDFVSIRRKRAENLEIQRHTEHGYLVYNPENNNSYEVITSANALACECKDYEKQIKALNQGCCKHGYKVLNHLGYNKLKDYIQANHSQTMAA